MSPADPPPHLHTCTSSNPVNSPALVWPVTDSSAPPSSSTLVLVVAGLVSVVLLVLLVWGVLWRKQNEIFQSLKHDVKARRSPDCRLGADATVQERSTPPLLYM